MQWIRILKWGFEIENQSASWKQLHKSSKDFDIPQLPPEGDNI